MTTDKDSTPPDKSSEAHTRIDQVIRVYESIKPKKTVQYRSKTNIGSGQTTLHSMNDYSIITENKEEVYNSIFNENRKIKKQISMLNNGQKPIIISQTTEPGISIQDHEKLRKISMKNSIQTINRVLSKKRSSIKKQQKEKSPKKETSIIRKENSS